VYWADAIAERIIERAPEKERYTCAAGISPSGSVHIGNFRDIATSLFVVKALQRRGKNVRLLFSWDDFDRFRKIPQNVAEQNKDMDRYLGYPYVDVENPFADGYSTYAEHFEKEFEVAIEQFGIELEYRYQAKMYRSGSYVAHIITALKKRREIFDILDEFRTQDSTSDERDNYYPITIYCPVCKRDTTRIQGLSDDCRTAQYRCACGHSGVFDFESDFNCKLPWKVDWPMRWLYEDVDFEPGGKDHASPGGSYTTSSRISSEVFGFQPPFFQGYEFIGIKGATGKMSGSTGLNLTPETLLKLYQPEVILWLYSKTEPTKAFDFCFDDGILRQYNEFDAQYEAYRKGEASDLNRVIMENCLTRGETIKPVPMNLITQFGPIVDFNLDMLAVVLDKVDLAFEKDALAERLPLAEYWVEVCSPDKKYSLRTTRNWDAYEAFDEDEKQDVSTLYEFLSKGGYTLDELSTKLYDIIKVHVDETADQKVLKKKQAQFFTNIYQLLISRSKGPRLYLFLHALDPKSYQWLLDFSTPRQASEYSSE
jgi:lysyl-tRNA synthetase class 1